MRAYSLSALFAACTLHLAVSAHAATTDNAATTSIDEAFRVLLKEGRTSQDSVLVPLARDWIYAGEADGAYPFIDHIPTNRGILLKTRLPITGEPERPQRDLAEVLETVNAACASSGGSIVHRDIPVPIAGPEVPQVARGFKALAKDGLMGQFWCERSKADPVFFVEVQPNSGAKVPLIPTGWDWNIALRPVPGSVLAQYVSRRSDYEKSASTLRDSLKAGDLVQVSTQTLPDSLTGAWQKRFPRQRGSVCGLVTEVKRPLAKVQFQAVELSVDIDKLFPQGTTKSLNEVTVTDQLQPQTWCLR